MTNKEPLEKAYAVMFHYFTKLHINQMRQMTSVIFLPKYSCYACYRDKVYTGHALDIKSFITIGDITNGFAWWVSYMGQKSL